MKLNNTIVVDLSTKRLVKSYGFLFSSWELCVIILWELVSGIYPGAKLANCLEKSELLWSSLEYITTELGLDDISRARDPSLTGSLSWSPGVSLNRPFSRVSL